MKKETERKRDRNKEILYTRNILRTNSKSPAPHTAPTTPELRPGGGKY